MYFLDKCHLGYLFIEEITNDIDKSMVPKFLLHTKNKTRNNTFLSKTKQNLPVTFTILALLPKTTAN